MTGWLLAGLLLAVPAQAAAAGGTSADRKAIEHILEVEGLPADMALLVTHNHAVTDYVTVIRGDGLHSLAGWFPYTRHSLSSPRIVAVPTTDLGPWMDQVEEVVAAFDRKERAWLDEDERIRGPRPRLEIELPSPRVDCGRGLRVQRRGPGHWPDQYVEHVQVAAATADQCTIDRTPPELPSALSSQGWSTRLFGLAWLGGGLLLLGLSLRRRVRS